MPPMNGRSNSPSLLTTSTMPRAAIKEMYRQLGNLIVDEAGVARHGLIVRHLILPNGLAASEESLS